MNDKKTKKMTSEELKDVNGGIFYPSPSDRPRGFTCAKCGKYIDLQGNQTAYKRYEKNNFWCMDCGRCPPDHGPGSGIT